MSDELYFLVPAGVDDPRRPSGGNIYDLRVAEGLRAAGRDVRELRVPEGATPSLAGVPDAAMLVADGLVAGPALLAHAERVRLVLLVHMPVLDEAERALAHAARAVVATSSWARDTLLGAHGLDPARVHVARPGAEAGPIARGTPSGGALLCIGAVAPHKGQDVLVETLGRLRDRDWRCTVVGPLDRDPAFVERVRHRADELDLGARVEFTGPRSRAGVTGAYAAADLLVLPSRTESYGMVVTEALAQGLPVLAAEVGGVPEALGRTAAGHVPGLLVAPADAAGFAAALERWLDDPALRSELRDLAVARRATLPSWRDTTTALLAAVNAKADADRRS